MPDGYDPSNEVEREAAPLTRWPAGVTVHYMSTARTTDGVACRRILDDVVASTGRSLDVTCERCLAVMRGATA